MASRARSIGDKNQIYAGAMLSFYASFERGIEEVFLGLLTGKLGHSRSDVKSLVSFPDDGIARSIVFDGRNYVDWLPFDRHLKSRAPLYFEDGRPFLELDSNDRRFLIELGTIRNALAHQSRHSLELFDRTFVQGKSLPASQRSPAGYLRGSHSLTETRLELIMSQALVVIRKFCT
jgi:hypothetical protein